MLAGAKSSICRVVLEGSKAVVTASGFYPCGGLYVRCGNSSYEVWQILERSFGYVSENRLLQLHIQLQELTTDDESVAQFL